MIKLLRASLILLALPVLFMLTGCGSDHEEDLAVIETLYEPGEAVGGIGYSNAQTIKLFLWKDGIGAEEGSFEEVSNGEYVDPGIHRLGITVTKRVVGGKAMNQRVFVSDGGWDCQEEALKGDAGDYYVCDFDFPGSDTYLTYPILIQVIYPDGCASKEKFVVTTHEGLRPKPGMLVGQGLGITLSANILDGLKDAMTPLIADTLPGLKIKGLSPADNTTGGGDGVLHLDIGIASFDLALNDTYKENETEIRGLTIGIEDLAGGTPDNLASALFNIFSSIFFKIFGDQLIERFNLDAIPIMPVSLPLADMLTGLAGSDDADSGDPMAGLLGGLEMDSILFLNIFGMPEETNPSFAVIGGGMYVDHSDAVDTNKEGNFLWPDVEIDNTDPYMDLNELKSGTTDVGIALSQYNLNQVLSEMMHGFSMGIEDIQDLMPMVGPENPNNSLDLVMTINPGGIAIDMKGDVGLSVIRLVANDMRLEFIEAGTPRAELSMDLTLNLNIDIHEEDGELFLDLAIEPLADFSHIHVMKDDLGLDIFDHSKFVTLIFSGLAGGGQGDAMVISIPLSDMGLTPRQGVEPGKVELDGMGNCFMSLALDSIDPSKLIGDDTCFISTAGVK